MTSIFLCVFLNRKNACHGVSRLLVVMGSQRSIWIGLFKEPITGRDKELKFAQTHGKDNAYCLQRKANFSLAIVSAHHGRCRRASDC